MLTNHPLNYDLSKEVYETCKFFMKAKECYTNVFHTISFFTNKFKSGEWKIAYGYLRIFKDNFLMARHCFIVNEQGEAIDPTLFCLQYFNKDDDKNHLSFSLLELNEYFELVEGNEYKPDLIKTLSKYEETTSDVWAKENGYILIK